MALAALAAIVALVVFQPGQQSAAAVDLGDSVIWVEHALDGELLGVNAVTGEITTRIPVSEPGVDFTAHAHGDGAVILDPSTNVVSIVSGTRLEVVDRITVPLSNGTTTSNSTVFGQSDSQSDVLIIEDEQLIGVSPETSEVTQRPLSVPLTPAQAATGEVFGFSPTEDLIVRVAFGDVAGVANVLPASEDQEDQRQLLVSGGRVFAIDPNRLALSEVSLDGGLGDPICMRGAVDGAVHGGSGASGEAVVASLNADAGVLALSTAEGECRELDVDVDPGKYGPPVVHGAMAYLPFFEQGRLIGVSMETGEVLIDTRFGTPGESFELYAEASKVWANDRLGPLAVMIEGSEVTAVPKVTALLSTEGVEGQGDGSVLVPAQIERSGLRILGDQGEEVIAADGNNVEEAVDENGLVGNERSDDSEVELEPFDFETSVLGVAIEPDSEDQGDGAGSATLDEALLANFSISTTEATVGQPIRFTDTSLGTPVTWSWTFGDGTASAVPDPEKAWDVEGVYAVTLTVTNAQGANSSQTAEIRIAPGDVVLAPNADFQFSSATVEVGESVLFESRTTGQTNLLEWDLGDGSTATGEAVTHTYSTAGSFDVVLTATNEAGSSTSTVSIAVLDAVEAPTAVIAPFPSTVTVGQFVNLESASLNAPTAFAWRFGDGESARGESVRYAWSAPGTYRIFLDVENSEGSDQVFADITVERRLEPPVAQFTQDAVQVIVGEAVRFASTSLNEPDRFTWDFGDGSTSTAANPSHQWNRAGVYQVSLRATNDAGTDRAFVNITVVRPVDPPVASFRTSTTTVATGQDVVFTDTSTNNPTSWLWTFEGSGEVSNQNPFRKWSRPGTYTVRLTVQNDGGRSSTETEITVVEAPTAAFRVEQVDDDTFRFFSEAQNATGFQWDFGDGSTSQSPNPSHTFAPGVYQVELRTSNEVASAGPARQQIVVAEPPVGRITCRADGAILTCSAAGSTGAESYRWIANSVTNSTPNAETTEFTFASRGRKTISLDVTNAQGQTTRASIRSPRVAAGQAPQVIAVEVVEVAGDVVTVRSEFGGDPTGWAWELDGVETINGANSANPTFRVPAPGTYSGFVTASNPFGDTRAPVEFVVPDSPVFRTAPPAAALTWEEVEPGLIRYFNNSESLPDAAVTWNFRDAEEVVERSDTTALVRYSTPDNRVRAILTIVDDNGRDRVIRFHAV